MADTIINTPNSIGYLPPAEATEVSLPYASLLNKAGWIVDGSTTTVQASMEMGYSTLTYQLTGSLVDLEGNDTYPLAGYSYMIIHVSNMSDCTSAIELARFIRWIIFSHQASIEAENVMMIPVSSLITQKIEVEVLEQLTCNGQAVYPLLQQQINEEIESLKTWKKPVTIISPIIGLIIISLIGFGIRQKVNYGRMLDRSEWKVDFFQIELFIPKRRRDFIEIKPLDNFDAHSLQDVHLKQDHVTDFHGKLQSHLVTLSPMKIVHLLDVVEKVVSRSLTLMRETIQHENIARFLGLSTSNSLTYMVREYCERGPLNVVIRHKKHPISDSLNYALSGEVVRGMTFLHKMNFIHGNLRTSSCLVDSKWSVKITDWEYNVIHDRMSKSQRKPYYMICKSRRKPYYEGSLLTKLHNATIDKSDEVKVRQQVWSPPEVLRLKYLCEPTKAGDVYQFALVMYEIFAVSDPFIECISGSSTADVMKSFPESHRPQLKTGMPLKARQIIEFAWNVASIKRPNFEQIAMMINSANSSGKANVIDNIIETMEDCITELETRVLKFETLNIQVDNQPPKSSINNRIPPALLDRITERNEVITEMHHDSVIVLTLRMGKNQGMPSPELGAVWFQVSFMDAVARLIVDHPAVYVVEQLTDSVILAAGLERQTSYATTSGIANLALAIVNQVNDAWVSKAGKDGSSDNHPPNLLAAISCGAGSSELRWSKGCPVFSIRGDVIDACRKVLGNPLDLMQQPKIQLTETVMLLLSEEFITSCTEDSKVGDTCHK